MKIFVVGLNHKSAPINIRDMVMINMEDLIPVLDALKSHEGLAESCVISTCNRTELYGILPKESEQTVKPYNLFKSIYPDLKVSLNDYLFHYTNEEAVLHLFRVSAGLNSLALGEPQIFGQVKAAYKEAANNKNTGAILNRLFHETFAVTKRIRTDTRIGEGSISISFAAVEMARKIFGDLKSLRFLIIGAGETGTLTARHFRERGVTKMLVANRTPERAEKLAARISGSAIRFDEINTYLNQTDVIVTCMGADTYTISYDAVAFAMKERKNRPLFFIDLGAPRDVNPKVGTLYNVFVYDIDDLKEIVKTNLARRENELTAAEAIIDEEVKEFFGWYSTIGVLPTIQKLQERMETIRREEIEQNKNKLNSADMEQVELLSRSIVKKILRDPILRLKEMAKSSRGLEEAEVLKKLFNLEDSSPEEKEQ